MVLLGNWQLRPVPGAQRDQRADRRRPRSQRRRRWPRSLPAPGRPAGHGGPGARRPTRPGPGSRSPGGTTRRTRSWSAAARSRAGSGFEIVTPLRAGRRHGRAGRPRLGPTRAGRGDRRARRCRRRRPGEVTVVGRVHLLGEPRRRRGPRATGGWTPRRIAVPQLAARAAVPGLRRVRAARRRRPRPRTPAFAPVPSRRENAWQNGGYAVQWWLFAGAGAGRRTAGWPAGRRGGRLEFD